MFTRDSVREMVARAHRGEGAKRIARNSGWIARPSSVGSGWARGSRGGINRGHGQSMVSLSLSSGEITISLIL
jgi:hypothetical protein